jgi:hypothetical protein
LRRSKDEQHLLWGDGIVRWRRARDDVRAKPGLLERHLPDNLPRDAGELPRDMCRSGDESILLRCEHVEL